jgi:hypothetical protein
MTRLLTAALLIPAAWYLCKRAPFSMFLAGAVLFAGIAVWEASAILRRRGSRPFSWLAVMGSAGIVAAFALEQPFGAVVAVMTGVALVGPALAMWRHDVPETMLDASMTTFFRCSSSGFPLPSWSGCVPSPARTVRTCCFSPCSA